MVALGGECVFASDIDKWAIQTYFDNYHIDSAHNIRDVKEEDIPQHDVLCGGFPCQAFSNAGHKRGFEDTRGTLFFEIARILKYHKTRFIILEK
jgi:DNA (cytosine-5)-methyltransferase 1